MELVIACAFAIIGGTFLGRATIIIGRSEGGVAYLQSDMLASIIGNLSNLSVFVALIVGVFAMPWYLPVIFFVVGGLVAAVVGRHSAVVIYNTIKFTGLIVIAAAAYLCWQVFFAG